MEAFDLLELPVVDKDNRLVGVVTADEAMGVLQEEATEDMEMMAAITPSERPYLDTPVWRIFASRIPWLLLLMLSAAFTGAIIQHFEAALAAQVALTAFIPMLMDTGGNCGSQSSVTVIRGLSLGQIRFGDWLRVLWKELRVGLLCGASLAAVNLLGLGMMGFDKSVAGRNGRRAAQGKPSRRRVPERTLFLTAALGGSAGALAGMYLFRHKPKHWYFVWGMPGILAAQLALLWFLTR